MALKKLIKNQVITIDDHKRGCRDIKNWDDECLDVHIDKTTNFPLNGKIQKVRIRIPINSERPIKIEDQRGEKMDEIPTKLRKEIQDALKDKETRKSFVNDVMNELKNFQTALSSEERATQVLTNISKHFELGWPEETTTNYAKGNLSSLTLVYNPQTQSEFFAKIDREKIEIGQYSGYAKQKRKLNR